MEPRAIVVGVGANLGSKLANVHAANAMLEAMPDVRVVARSKLYDTDPVGPAPQPRYLNAALRVETTREPLALLEACLAIEKRLGRDRETSGKWGPRPIDLDLLHAFDLLVREPALEVPHPRLAERAFALAPLLDVAPELEPTFGATLEALGGPPPSRRFSPAPVARNDSYAFTAHAADDADGWVLALSAVASALAGAVPLEATQTFEVAALPELPEVVVTSFARGFAVRLVTIASIGPGSIRGAIHGALRPRREVRMSAARVQGGYVWTEGRLGPSSPALTFAR